MKSNIEVLLGEWGAWKRGENRSSLGYPGQSAFQRMRVDGQRRADPYALMVDDDLRKVDEHIARLFPEAHVVVVAHYVWPGPVKTKLDRVKATRTRYYDLLEMAHKQLSHWMGERYQIPCVVPAEFILSGHLV
ncbi:hypothetical protein [Bordetella genomosp. 4]|uniref:Antitermination protein Q n=1 Tax=Bordetella genomosp. 4 TaxID=463044 RepID=A0A261U5R7_9BORD|nr:hypothetical protein [Bordetella genomosp. 4]OZI56752.1 hypothetical protein CAL20_15240 [Bordetella genomosp. 4]